MLLRSSNELLLCIAENLEFAEHINAFARTNTCLYNLLNTYLYRYDVQHFGSSALMWAVKHGQEATAQKSLEAGAHAQFLSKYKETPLSLAAQNGHEAVVKLLLATEGVNPDSQDSNGLTPLSWAARYGYEAVVKLLRVTVGVNPNYTNSCGEAPLLGNKTQELLDRARGPVGPPVSVEFGTEHRPLAELAELLSTMNGFFAFNAGVQIFHVGPEGAGPELLHWNTAQAWKDTFEGLTEGIFCFGQDVLGTQYAIHNGSEVVSFDPEDARPEHIGYSLEDWSARLLDDPPAHATSTLAKVWQDREGVLRPNQRLIPRTFFIFGGEVALENLTVTEAVEAMRMRGPIAAAISDLPPGSTINLIPVKPSDPVNDTWSGGT